ncbi:hypothetical protein CPB83DRAFT_846560 [Crepidotus variabilis]|uniref:Uncharacterized protein n=1 Tax=Crepidotus variabilis TaxID=179855 RepID=A0A9P6EN91_9AGAR|nr:hypothetical protein CPB83DRAFT_846560 [Crepidotus variabilis]
MGTFVGIIRHRPHDKFAFLKAECIIEPSALPSPPTHTASFPFASLLAWIMSASASSSGPSRRGSKDLLHLMKVWSACLIGPEAFVRITSIFRLILRRRTSGLWWDDYFALLA